jgi:hypothetical protein
VSLAQGQSQHMAGNRKGLKGQELPSPCPCLALALGWGAAPVSCLFTRKLAPCWYPAMIVPLARARQVRSSEHLVREQASCLLCI